MNRLKKSQGISLVEVLATIVILSIIIVTIWSFLVNSFQINEREVRKAELQQEANLIFYNIQKYHTKYNIKLTTNKDNSELNINAFDIDSGKTYNAVFNNSKYLYYLPDDFAIDQTLPNNFSLHLKISSKKNEKIFVEAKTTFSKIE